MVDMTDYGVDKVLDGAAVASTGSATSAWFPCSNTKEFSVWAKSTSAGGTADVKTYSHVVFPPKDKCRRQSPRWTAKSISLPKISLLTNHFVNSHTNVL